jgi:hypothetical protein
MDRQQRRRAEPTPPPPPRRARTHQPVIQPAVKKRGAFARMLRGIGAIIALLLIAGAVAAAVIISTDQSTGHKIEKVILDNVRDQVDGLKRLIQDNTK